MLDELSTSNRLLSTEVVTLRKSQLKWPKATKVLKTEVNTDTVSDFEFCSITFRHLRGLQNDIRSLRSQLLRECQNATIKKKEASLAFFELTFLIDFGHWILGHEDMSFIGGMMLQP